MADEHTFRLGLERVQNFEFQVQFGDDLAPLTVDEPEPLGGGKGPNASRLLGAAVGNCLSASLLFCLEKARIPLEGMRTEVTGHLERNERGRWRVVKLDVHITLNIPHEDPQRVGRCLGVFEDYCVVTASVRKGIPVSVRVEEARGTVLLEQE